MRLIALYGHSNCGKSNTLNRLKEMLRVDGKSLSSSPHPWCENPETFEYNGQIICVAPAGDSSDIINANLRYFDSKKCDVAITGSRSKGGTIKALVTYATKQGVSIEWVPKSYEHALSKSTQELCNQETAQIIFDMI